MKLLAYSKLTIKQMFRESVSLLLVFSVFPLALSGLLAYSQRDLFSPSSHMKQIEINLKDEDNSTYSRGLVQFLSTGEVGEIVRIREDDKKIKYKVVIPEGYEDSLLSSKECNIVIKAGEGGSRQSFAILTQLIDKYNEEASQQVLIAGNMNRKNISVEEKEVLLSKINTAINEAYSTDSIKDTIISGKKTLSSFEYYSVTLMGFLFIMLAMSLAAGVFVEQENGIYNRIISASVSKVQYFNYSLMTSFIFASVLNLIYVLVYRITGLSFNGSIALLVIVTFVYSILVTAVTGAAIAFFSKKSSAIFMNSLIIIQVVLGGMAFPLDKIKGAQFLKILANFSPDALISGAFKGYILYNTFDSIRFYILAMLAVSTILYGISLVKVNMKWGEQL